MKIFEIQICSTNLFAQTRIRGDRGVWVLAERNIWWLSINWQRNNGPWQSYFPVDLIKPWLRVKEELFGPISRFHCTNVTRVILTLPSSVIPLAGVRINNRRLADGYNSARARATTSFDQAWGNGRDRGGGKGTRNEVNAVATTRTAKGIIIRDIASSLLATCAPTSHRL